MIPAHKFLLGKKLVWWLIDSSLRKHFDRVFLRMRCEATTERSPLPMIMCANHSSWWDGYIATLVERALGVDGYLMMEEAQLQRYFFFAWAGCFSVNRQNTRSAMQSLQYAAHLLKKRPGRFVWLFPQGAISPNDKRPLVFFTGAAYLARLTTPVLLYPVATRIEYLAEQRPDLFISVGEPLLIKAEDVQARGFLKHCTKQLEVLVTLELDRLRNDVLASDYSSFTQIMHGRSSINRIFDAALFRKQIGKQ
ncbi:MAG: lysophospholipid acyltransferase family protein [Ktedonobacteraceae bacterium]|nr:lysophospholipid acyltransferase family protein [Ktedonobacteraceae bacterium]